MSFGRTKNPTFLIFIYLAQKLYIKQWKKNQLTKFDAKSDKGVFLSYLLTSKAHRVFNKRTLVVEESIHVVFDDFMSLASVDDVCENIDKLNLDDKINNEVHKGDKSNEFENLDSHDQPSNLSLPKE